MTRPVVPLTIAGSDPTGGAGLGADLKVFLRFGLSGAAVPTAWTAQGPSGVAAVEALSGRAVSEQLATLLRDVRPAAVKVGLLPNGEVVRAVARALSPLARRGIPIVIDPVLASSSGRRFLPEEDVPTFLRQLVPLATLITPNQDEAAELAGVDVSEVRKDPEPVVRALLRHGCKRVLVKGGHGAGQEAVDVLGSKEELVLYSLPRIPRRRAVHGTGCALSAAIAALLAQGAPLEDAVQLAKEFVSAAIEGSKPMGRGGARMLDFQAALPDPTGLEFVEESA